MSVDDETDEYPFIYMDLAEPNSEKNWTNSPGTIRSSGISTPYSPPTIFSPWTSPNTKKTIERYDDSPSYYDHHPATPSSGDEHDGADSLFEEAQPSQEPATPDSCQTNMMQQLNGVAINEAGECMYLNWGATKPPVQPPNADDPALQESTALVPSQPGVMQWLNQVPAKGTGQSLSPDRSLIKRPASPGNEDDQPLSKKPREETQQRPRQIARPLRGNKKLTIVIGEGKVTVSSEMEYPGQIRINLSSGDQEMMDVSMSDTQSVEKEDVDDWPDDKM